MTEDYTTLNNPQFLYQAELHQPFPDWVVQHAVPEKDDFQKRASTAFADQNRRLLPICSKEAAFHSMINVAAKLEDYDDETFDRVKEACAHYGIESAILPYIELFIGEIEKSASLSEIPEGRYAINTNVNGEDFKLLPLNDEEDVVSSAFDLAKMASDRRIHLLMLVPAAREIVKAAADYSVDRKLPSTITRLGVERFPDVDRATKLIVGREDLCKDASIRATLAADYKAVLDYVDAEPDEAMQKIAAIDHVAGLEPNYSISTSVPTPFDIVFSGALTSDAEKAAKEHVIVREVLVPLGEIRRIPALDADYKLSKSASESFSKMRDTGDARDLSLAIENWPEADQKTLLRMAVDSAA